jgi:hypothetical protein
MAFSTRRKIHRRRLMKKIALISAGILALSSSAALAQTNWMPPGPNSGPGGATGAAPTRDVGNNTPNVAHTANGQTNSDSMLDQSVKEQSAAGAPRSVYSPNAPTQFDEQQAMAGDEMAPNGRRRHRVAITDEYGFHYDSRGDRLDARGYVISPHAR